MSQKRIKILIFISSFILLLSLLSFFDLGKKINYYNLNPTNKIITIEIDFHNSLDGKEVELYYSDSINSNNPFSISNKITSRINNQTAQFKLHLKEIPKLLRLNFDRNIRDTIFINQITLCLIDQKINLDLTNFVAHPSIQILKKESNSLTIDLQPNKNTKYDPYLYLEKPIYAHEITAYEIFLIVTILSLLSFLFSELFAYLLNFKFSNKYINSVLIFLLLISFLFKEHWISKGMILIGIYTFFLIIKKKIQVKKVHFYGFLLFFMFAAISLIWSVNIEKSLPKLIGLLPFLIIPVWTSSLDSKVKYEIIFKYVGVFFMMISLFTILLASIRYNTTFQESEFYYHTLSSPLSTNAIYLSLLYLMVYIINLNYLLKKNFKGKWIDFLSLLVIFIYIILLSSKLLSFLLFIATAIMLYSSLKTSFKNWKLISILAGAIGMFLILIFTSNNNLSKRFDKIIKYEKVKEVFSSNKFGNTYLWNGLNLRLVQLRAFYEIEKDEKFNSFLGVGLNNGQEHLNKKYKHYKMYTGKSWEKNGGFLTYNFHNQYAQTLIELGAIGFFLLIFIFYDFFTNAINNRNFLLFSVVFVFILTMFTESILVRQKGIMFFTFFPIITIVIHKYIKQERISV